MNGAPRGRKRIAVVLFVGLGLVLWGPLGKRLRAGYDEAWVAAVQASAEPLQAALELHKERVGIYPLQLRYLVPDELAEVPEALAHPADSGPARWFYMRGDGTAYHLGITADHWVSSFDALIFSSAGAYPASWLEADGSQRAGDWLYVRGASGVFREEGFHLSFAD